MEEKEVQLKDCVECGTQFKPNSSRQKYCSGKCSDKVYNRKRRESAREFSRQWRKDNAERAHATAKEYRETHKKEERARGRRWLATPRGRELARASQQRYREKQPETMKARAEQRARAHEEGNATKELIERKWLDGDQTCCVCGDLIDEALPGGDPMGRTIEHDLPISRGGRHDLDNIFFSHMRCNSAKGRRTIAEYLDWLDDPYENGRFTY